MAQALPAPFDLAGPVLEVKVTRAGSTLPISQVPNLAAADQIWIKADLPADQSAHYLMVAAFLSGATNPPPERWFFQCKLWTGKCAGEGLKITVPPGAQQVILFLAPETGGDFRTLVGAVRGRPGAFVRTSQDLNQAALDRSRLETFLASVRQLSNADPGRLKEAAPLLARSLAIKVDDKCMDRLPQLQAPCLMQGQESLILSDGHSTSIVEALTSGPGSDLALEASYTPQLSYGYYSPYIASVLDIARIMDSFRTARYQYIPALASPSGDTLALTLNTAPSFHSPMSVLVVALPAVEKPQPPPLHAVDPAEIFCARRSSLVLPVDGAPLAFSTNYAHDLVLGIAGSDGSDGKVIDLPVRADPIQGGYVVDTAALSSAVLGDSIHATLKGFWGFERYEGPGFRLVNVHAKSWDLAARDESALIVGRQDTIHLEAASVSCIDAIMLKDPAGKQLKVEWKATRPDEIELQLPLQDAAPGDMTLLVKQYGDAEPRQVAIRAFGDAGRFDGFTIHAGDSVGILRGSRLDEVTALSVQNALFVPQKLTNAGGSDELSMTAQDPRAALALSGEHPGPARITLKDGRRLSISATLSAARPAVQLISTHAQDSPASLDSKVVLDSDRQLPLDSVLTFSVRSISPASFSRDETIEIADADESLFTALSLGSGGMVLANPRVAVVTLNPSKTFGESAFGPLRFRVNAKGVVGDWQPLARLVRVPVLKQLQCPATAETACKLTGLNLFLIDAAAGDSSFTHAIKVPDGFLGAALPVPHPASGQIYVKLRDDPTVVNAVSLAAESIEDTPESAERAAVRGSAFATPPPAESSAN